MPQNNTPYLSDPDVLLMLDFQKGNVASFETLMRKYYSSVFNFIYRFVGSRETAEDLTQEVFTKVYKAVSSYQPQAKFQTWVFTIAKNASLNELRKNKRKFFSLDDFFRTKEKGEELKKQLEDTSSESPRRKMEEEERREKVREAIHLLPENQRVAVLLRRYEDFSYEEIAKAMNLSVPAVKSLLSRARENLKVSLGSFVQEY